MYTYITNAYYRKIEDYDRKLLYNKETNKWNILFIPKYETKTKQIWLDNETNKYYISDFLGIYQTPAEPVDELYLDSKLLTDDEIKKGECIFDNKKWSFHIWL